MPLSSDQNVFSALGGFAISINEILYYTIPLFAIFINLYKFLYKLFANFATPKPEVQVIREQQNPRLCY